MKYENTEIKINKPLIRKTCSASSALGVASVSVPPSVPPAPSSRVASSRLAETFSMILPVRTSSTSRMTCPTSLMKFSACQQNTSSV